MSTEERLERHLGRLREERESRAPTPQEHLAFALHAVAAAEPRPGLWIVVEGGKWFQLGPRAAVAMIAATMAEEAEYRAAEQERYAEDQEHLAAQRVTRLVSRLGISPP